MGEQDRVFRSQSSPRKRTWIGIAGVALLAILSAAYLLAVLTGAIRPANRLTTPEVLLALSVIVLIVLVSQTQYVIKDLALSPSGVSAHLDRIEDRQDNIETDVAALQIVVSGLVTKFERAHLEGLSGLGPYTVQFSNIMVDELKHLDAMHYLIPLKANGLNAIGSEHGDGLSHFDLKEYVKLTPEGRQYLALKADLDARMAAARLSSAGRADDV